MTYELAKELKDAGFPQIFQGGSICFDPNGTRYIHLGAGHNGNEGLYAEYGFSCCLDEFNKEDSAVDINHFIKNILDSELVLAPTLSQLIEACGDKLWSLTKHANIWQTNFVDGMAGETAGRTASEAVAHLWLK